MPPHSAGPSAMFDSPSTLDEGVSSGFALTSVDAS